MKPVPRLLLTFVFLVQFILVVQSFNATEEAAIKKIAEDAVQNIDWEHQLGNRTIENLKKYLLKRLETVDYRTEFKNVTGISLEAAAIILILALVLPGTILTLLILICWGVLKWGCKTIFCCCCNTPAPVAPV